MSESRARPERGPATGETGKQGKKPYRKPAFRHERVFETMALSCGKMDPTQAQCLLNRKVS
jgi:hypothetical protein